MNNTTTTRNIGWARTSWYGAELALALVCIYALAFIGYAVVRSTIMIMATQNLDSGLAGILIATWVSLAFASIVAAALCALPAALIGAVTALAIRAVLLLTRAGDSPSRGSALGGLICFGVSLALIALLSIGRGVAWTPATLEALTFWVVLPLMIYVLAGALASRRLAQVMAMRTS